jgi:16S rRNA (uracil1498-N3)-methyltransferase
MRQNYEITERFLKETPKDNSNNLILCKYFSMHIFYAPDISGNEYTLDENESRHCIRVLRMKSETPVRVIDGKGNLYEAVITNPDPKKCSLAITGVIRDFEKRNYRLHIAISPLKNYERLEWFIEKSVEIGVDEITPLICSKTEKPGLKRERINNLIISAMKQSLKSTLTILNEPCRFNDFITTRHAGNRLIAHCNNEVSRCKIAEVYASGNDAVLLIGPEGDFTKEEILSAISAGYLSVHLGRSRLRTETAGVAACHSIYFINQ